MRVLVAFGTLGATRTHHTTGEKRDVLLHWSFQHLPTHKNESYVFVLHDGVTGFESFYVNKKIIDEVVTSGWSACAGTDGRWDSLFISAKEMARVFKQISSAVEQISSAVESLIDILGVRIPERDGTK